MMSCAEIALAIDASLDFLATTWRDTPIRQRSLRAAFDRDWGLLTLKNRIPSPVYRSSVVVSAIPRCAPVVGTSCVTHCRQHSPYEHPVPSAGCLFKALADKDMLREIAPGRYCLHGLLRRYAQEKLAATEAECTDAHVRHCAYFAGLADRAGTESGGPRKNLWCSRLNSEQENFEAALQWALGRPDLRLDAAQRIAPVLARYRQNP